ncbi:hypothetical protein AVEN_236555-1 [Araneus ventricosus]|uniref:Uncharacterized protein n=1 Tax=Araneus ventricosus TaxID=182803 RepID=A0A4Y2LN53_ARAVE|nr:hypothetical protein AVEN_236555-1 [Araneus ventricosus]
MDYRCLPRVILQPSSAFVYFPKLQYIRRVSYRRRELNSLPIVLFLNILFPNKFYRKSGDSMKSKKCLEGHLGTGVTITVTSSEGDDNNITNNVSGKKERDVKTREGNAVLEIGNSLENKVVTLFILNRSTHDHAEGVPRKIDGVALSPSNEFNMCILSLKETGSETRKDRMELVFAECLMISEAKPKNSNHGKKMKLSTDEKINELQYDFKDVSIPAKLVTNDCEGNLLQSTDCTRSKTGYKLKAEIKIY